MRKFKRIVVLLCTISIFICGCSSASKTKIADENNRVYKFFKQYFDNGKYLVDFKSFDSTLTDDMICTMAVDGENYYFQYKTSDGTQTFVVTDGKRYGIYDEMKTYTVEDTPENTALQDDFNSKNIIGKEYTLCKEIIGMSSYSYDCEKFVDENGVETRYCFDNDDNLKYIVTYEDGKTVYLEFLNISTDVNPSYFKIPEGYEKIEY